jgi:hypothetical protein
MGLVQCDQRGNGTGPDIRQLLGQTKDVDDVQRSPFDMIVFLPH